MKFLLRELTRTPTANKDTHRNLYAQNLGGCPGSAPPGSVPVRLRPNAAR